MREIKFRAWNDLIENFAYFENGKYWYDTEKGHFDDGWHAFDWKKAEQYTGLKDKNGKEWYEGDKTDVEDETFAVVVFEEGTFCFKWYEVCERGEHEYIETCPMTHYHYDTMEIIGNIHENKELLK